MSPEGHTGIPRHLDAPILLWEGKQAVKSLGPGVAAPVVTAASQEVGLGLALLTGV